MVVALSTAQAAEPETLTLACEGKSITIFGNQALPPLTKPLSIGIIVNFRTHTVQGLGAVPLYITVDDTTIGLFNKTDSYNNTQSWETKGSISRVTGALSATETVLSKSAESVRVYFTTEYFLKCRPAQRMF